MTWEGASTIKNLAQVLRIFQVVIYLIQYSYLKYL